MGLRLWLVGLRWEGEAVHLGVGDQVTKRNLARVGGEGVEKMHPQS